MNKKISLLGYVPSPTYAGLLDVLLVDSLQQAYLAKGCSIETPDVAKLTVAKFNFSFVYTELIELTEDELNNWRLVFLGING